MSAPPPALIRAANHPCEVGQFLAEGLRGLELQLDEEVLAQKPIADELLHGRESMSKRRYDPRRDGRVPMSGGIQWRSGLGSGIGEILDMSSSGAGFIVPVREAFQIGPGVALNTELTEGLDLCVAENATVRRKIPRKDGTCRIGVEFSPLHAGEKSGEDNPAEAPV